MANCVSEKEKHQLEEKDYDPVAVYGKIQENSQLMSEFEKLINGSEIVLNTRPVHAFAKADVHGILGVFYRYFFTKHISNIQHVEAKSACITNHASIFPFKIDPNLRMDENRDSIMSRFDVKFLNVIRQFCVDHFDRPFDADSHINSLLANIEAFKGQHFDDVPYCGLRSVAEIGSRKKGARLDNLSDYLSTFTRLSDAGVIWYRNFENTYNDIAEIYGKTKLPPKSDSYFRYLPEINCCQLCLLLEPEFYAKHRRQYAKLFQKYLFFFGHAVKWVHTKCDRHPVFFIDDTLFECLKSKRKFEKCQRSVKELQWELWMVALLEARKFTLPDERHSKTIHHYRLDNINLENVIKYANQISGVEKASVYHVEPKHPKFSTFLANEDALYLMKYAGNRRRVPIAPKFFYPLILKAALLSRDIKKLVYYNAYLGQEFSIDMPSCKHEIVDFIRRHSSNDDGEGSVGYPEKFLVHNLSKYFVSHSVSD